MEINPVGSSEELSATQASSTELSGVYGEKIQTIKEKIAQGDFQGAKEQILKEFAEIDEKYKGCYMFLELAKFKSELNTLLKQVSAKL
ncbi:MAG: hypothetical protein H7A41_07595 [Chlamydiales bacterium]|nr:hypothetical protein [Chlamydiia bacterium]MCB9093471.1 hypothetical protein [Halobacteriovoraceae bacterium]MCP5504998.1 hypothetical protein [Chlamydiales bacterium]